KAVIGAALGVGLTALMLGGQGLGLGNKLMNPGLVSKPSVSSQKVDVPDGAGKGSGTVVGEGSSGITVSEQSLKHSTIGDFTFNPKTGAVSRMKGGGHGQSNINFLEEHGI
ncbi:MAG TPA: hypothetical protein DDY49_02845, partial [Paenibacillaceae bacterium]|nr:hypothetical protein [Paenibacillaceae bacterium]